MLDERHGAVRQLVLVVELSAQRDLERLRHRGLRLAIRTCVLESVGDANDDLVGVRRVDSTQCLRLGLNRVADREVPAATPDVELEIDRGERRLADMRAYGGEDLEQRAPGLAAEDRQQGLPLLLGCG